jgi:hypothetical protein
MSTLAVSVTSLTKDTEDTTFSITSVEKGVKAQLGRCEVPFVFSGLFLSRGGPHQACKSGFGRVSIGTDKLAYCSDWLEMFRC